MNTLADDINEKLGRLGLGQQEQKKRGSKTFLVIGAILIPILLWAVFVYYFGSPFNLKGNNGNSTTTTTSTTMAINNLDLDHITELFKNACPDVTVNCPQQSDCLCDPQYNITCSPADVIVTTNTSTIQCSHQINMTIPIYEECQEYSGCTSQNCTSIEFRILDGEEIIFSGSMVADPLSDNTYLINRTVGNTTETYVMEMVE